MDIGLPLPVLGRRAFTVSPEQATVVFGEHPEPPARPAAGDARPEEAREVLGTPGLLASVEFCARDSLHGHLPDGTGTLGEAATVRHRRAATVGTDLVVETVVVAVDGNQLSVERMVERAAADGAPDGTARSAGRVGDVDCTFRVVDRERFLGSLG